MRVSQSCKDSQDSGAEEPDQDNVRFHESDGQRQVQAEARARPPVLKATAQKAQPSSSNSRSVSVASWASG